MEVEIVSRKLVTPSTPTPHHLRAFKLSAMDQPLNHFHYPSFILIYELSNNDFLENAVNGRLEKSLSQVLTVYYPLAGRYLEHDKNIITCNDQGVELVEAKVVNGVQIGELQSDLDAKQFNLLVPDQLVPDARPLLFIQVSVFESGGVAIGVRFSHKVADGHSMALFMSDWATTNRLGLSQVVPMSFDCLPSLFPLRDDAHRIRFDIPKKEGGGVFVTKRFVFNKASIQSLREKIMKDEERKVPSRVVVVMAFIWWSLIRVNHAQRGYLRPSSQTMTVNLRGRTALPVPSRSFGNFITRTLARYVPEASIGKGVTEPPELQELVALLEGALEKAVAPCARLEDGEEVFAQVDASFREFVEELRRTDGVDVYALTSWCKFPFGEVDFGWGKPAWVCTTPVPGPVTTFIDTVDGEGVEAWVRLQGDEMLLFQQDPHILALNKKKTPCMIEG